ncbi:hypothetical protein IV203_005264 [Nitzschia inconspicua]|uniref:Uncharacterized protein n=1 Tax=Nitzschia inconspicua TaxID=303405 RepID=A0A9K3PGS2_9STRA|nr:hypothetical protein IV203_005264 [Nitzschia inconspicua]
MEATGVARIWLFVQIYKTSERFIVVEASETRPSEINETDFSKYNQKDYLNVKVLNELARKVVIRVVDKNGRAIDMEVNGTSGNTREFAELDLCHDTKRCIKRLRKLQQKPTKVNVYRIILVENQRGDGVMALDMKWESN